MALLSRIYFNAVFGAVGGLLGWMLFGVFGRKDAAESDLHWQLLLGGAFIGGAIGYFLVSVDALRDRSLLRFVRMASYGVALGAVGGSLGMWLGDKANFWLVRLVGSAQHGGIAALLVSVLARGLGWTLLGMAIGVSEGIAARSLGKFSYGTIGGALGGFVGGALYGFALQRANAQGGDAALWGAIGLIILGACIGSLSALVLAVFTPASVRVLRGWQEGREYPLDKDDTLLGRDEHADIALFRDMRVEKRHAFIHREGARYVLRNNQAPPAFTRVNDDPVDSHCDLRDGDRIQLGNIVLRFQGRMARAGGKRKR
jgi:MFS family permease